MTQSALVGILAEFHKTPALEIAMFDGTKISLTYKDITFLDEDIVRIMTKDGEFWIDVKAIAFVYYAI